MRHMAYAELEGCTESCTTAVEAGTTLFRPPVNPADATYEDSTMVTKQISSANPDRVEVTFSVPASIWADQIHLVGDFNRWDATATPMRPSEEGWSTTLLLEREHPVGYGYLLDGQTWMCDSNADAYERADGGKVISVLRA